MTEQTKRTHSHCRRCQIPLWPNGAHCDSHTCPWCRTCVPATGKTP